MSQLPRTTIGALLSIVLIALTAAAPQAEPQLKTSMSHGSNVSSIAFSPDGRMILTGSYDCSLRLWELETGRELRRLIGHEKGVDEAAFLGGGKTCVSMSTLSGDKTIRFWDLDSGSAYKTIALNKDDFNQQFALSPDGATIAYPTRAGDRDHYLSFLDARTFRTVRGFKTLEDMGTTAFTPDGRLLLATHGTATDSTVYLFDPSSGKALRSLGKVRDAVVSTLAVSPDGLTAFIGYSQIGKANGSFKLWSLKTGRVLKTVQADFYGVKSASFSPDGTSVAAVSGDSVFVWDLAKGTVLASRTDEKASAVSFSPDGTRLAVGYQDGSITLFDARLGTYYIRIGGNSVGLASIAPEDGALRTISKDGTLLLWDPATLRLKRLSEEESLGYYVDKGKRIELPRSLAGKRELVVSSDGKLAAYKSAAWGITLVDLAGHKALRSFSLPAWTDFNVVAIFLSPDDRTLAFTVKNVASNWDYHIKYQDREKQPLIIDMATGRVVPLLGSTSFVRTVAFSPDSRSLVSGGIDVSKQGALIWDIASARIVASLKIDRELPRISSLACSPDGKSVAVGDENGTGWVFDAASGRLQATLSGQMGRIEALLFDSDGRRLFSGGSEGVLRSWDRATGRQLAAAMTSPEGDWIAWTPDGFFDGTELAMKTMLYVVDGWKTYGIDQFYERFHRPDLLASRLGGKAQDVAVSAPADLKQGFAAPPEVSLAIKRKDGSFEVPAKELRLRGIALAAVQASDWLVEDGCITARVSAKDAGGGIDGARLYSSGKALGEDTRGLAVVQKAGAGWSREYRVPLVQGENLLRAVAYSRDRTESAPFELRLSYAPAAAAKPDMWILVAGADAYKNPKYKLNYALADATSFAAAMPPVASGVFGSVRVEALYDEQLSKEAILALLDKIAASARPDDVFVFFYAGHGVALQVGAASEFYFVMPTITNMQDPERLAASALSGGALRAAMARIPANKQLVLVDACNSGAFAAGFAVRGAAEDAALAQLSRASGAAVISSTTDTQFASEIEKIGHGVFTYALLQGLQGKAATKDGRITAGSLRTYVEEEMPALTKQYRGSEQYPTSFLFGQDFPVGTKR
jgi:WD40 repeat protein